MKRIGIFLLGMLCWAFSAGNCKALEEYQVSGPPNAAKIDFQVLEQDKVLVSALDSEGNPIQGLTVKDFTVKKGAKKAEILSVEPLATSREVGLNVALVVDNSFSMKERNAVGPVLSGLESFLGIVRPIDNVNIVTFDDDHTMMFGVRPLHVNVFKSNSVPELRAFFRKSYYVELSNRTFLYDAMVVGLDVLRKMPEQATKFLVVFSDGEDLNSVLSRADVEAAAAGTNNLAAYAIDYMPVPEPNRFLKAFSEGHKGAIWKAASADELIPIFKKFSTTLFDRYIVSYRFLSPPKGTLSVEPSELNLEMLSMLDGSPLPYYVFFETGISDLSERYVLFKDSTQTASFNEAVLKTGMDRYWNVLNLIGSRMRLNSDQHIRITGCNSDYGPEKNALELSGRRAESVRNYLSNVWGIEASRMKVEKRNLPVRASAGDVLGGRAENQRVEITYEPAAGLGIVDDFTSAIGPDEITVVPQIGAEYGLSQWEMSISGGQHIIKSVQGMTDINPSYKFGLNDLGPGKIAGVESLTALIKVTDNTGDVYQASSAPLPVKVSKKNVINEFVKPPYGAVDIAPEGVVVEEITTVDSSPLLNQIYFPAGQSLIPERYVLFKDKSEADKFQETGLKGSMDKYLQVLNVIGGRLRANPDSRITIVGCNSNTDTERNKLDLSKARAEAVQAYLKDKWGVDTARMVTEARNLPSVPSSSRVEDGKVENQRAEIRSDSEALLEPVKSTFIDVASDTKKIQASPRIQAGYGVAEWHVDLLGDGALISSVDGKGEPVGPSQFDVKEIGLQKISSFKALSARVRVKDEKGQGYETTSKACPVKLIKREEQLAQRSGYKVLEKYALILFDFDRADIKERNRGVINKIVARIQQVPSSKVRITGHTDSIGKPDYNLKLSEKRAKAVYENILAAGIAASDRITWEGVGQNDPLYSNSMPEGRALNRTVTVSIEYESKEQTPPPGVEAK